MYIYNYISLIGTYLHTCTFSRVQAREPNIVWVKRLHYEFWHNFVSLKETFIEESTSKLTIIAGEQQPRTISIDRLHCRIGKLLG